MQRSFPALLIAGLLAACGPAPEKEPLPDILLISIDTLRADHLGCYGYADARTPFLDELAGRGVWYGQVNTPVPLTLPAHASMMTGRIPPRHGVRLNSGPRLQAQAVTLAERLGESGYRTAAFLAAEPLHRRGGLDQGFELYDDTMPAGGDLNRRRPERYADEVLSRAEGWLNSADDVRPIFAFIHLFDPHWPYEKSLAGAAPSYDGEIAWVDRQLSAFFSRISSSPRWQRAWIVVTSDHGEGLGEHGESSHGLLVYESTLRVPLIFSGPLEGLGVEPRRIEEPVSLVDLAPTLLDLVGTEFPDEVDGRSLLPSMRGQALVEGPLYFESLYGRLEFGWAALRGLREGSLKFTSAPIPELYDLRLDPGETTNLHAERPEQVETLAGSLAGIDEGEFAAAELDPETRKRLASLGYLSARPVHRAGSGSDPKRMLDAFHRYMEAVALSESGRYPEALAAFESAGGDFEDSPRYLVHFGNAASGLGDWARAEELYRRALQLHREEPEALENLGVGLLKQRRTVEALEPLEQLLELDPGHPEANYLVGSIHLWSTRDVDRGIGYWRRMLASDPANPRAPRVGPVVAEYDQGGRSVDDLRRAFRASGSD